MSSSHDYEVKKCPNCKKRKYGIEHNDYCGPQYQDCKCAACGFEMATYTGSGIWDETIYTNRIEGLPWSEDERKRLVLCQNPIAANNGAPVIPLSSEAVEVGGPIQGSEEPKVSA